MPKVCYVEKKFSPEHTKLIARSNAIIASYRAQGYDLTLRQLYYQLVATNVIANKDTEYHRLGSIINDARLAGLIDWEAIVDRTRNLETLASWETPEAILSAVASQFRTDKWDTQQHRIEVWVEKDALKGVIARVCERLQIPYFSCRGYTSQSEMWQAARRLCGYEDRSQDVVILHLGDHDPSGIDMSRDIEERLALFGVGDLTFQRIALNMDQIDQYNPPPNPAKLSDGRSTKYIETYGSDSWELDALSPSVIADLIETNVLLYRDDQKWEEAVQDQEQHREHLITVAARWEDVTAYFAVKDPSHD